MGLSGKDLVSLGGHIARAEARTEATKNLEIARNFPVDKVGKDQTTSDRWSIKTIHGRYTCAGNSWNQVQVKSNKTGQQKTFVPDHYELGRSRTSWRVQLLYRFVLDMHAGKILLDF